MTKTAQTTGLKSAASAIALCTMVTAPVAFAPAEDVYRHVRFGDTFTGKDRADALTILKPYLVNGALNTAGLNKLMTDIIGGRDGLDLTRVKLLNLHRHSVPQAEQGAMVRDAREHYNDWIMNYSGSKADQIRELYTAFMVGVEMTIYDDPGTTTAPVQDTGTPASHDAVNRAMGMAHQGNGRLGEAAMRGG